jgi:S1-C subfamily serine protease
MEEIAARHGIREGFGVVIVEVMADTPAARAGLRNGDIVVEFDGRPVVETRALQRFIASASSETDTRLTVLRSDGRRALSVRLAEMPRAVAGERVAAEFGFVIRETEGPGDPTRRPLSASPSVTVVIRGSPAEKAGLEVGDVLLQVNEQAVVTREAAREALADATIDRPLRLTVRRGDVLVSLTLAKP